MQFVNYDCENQVLEFQSIASNRIIHLSVGESGGYMYQVYTSTSENNNYSPKWRYIHVSTTFTNTEVNNAIGSNTLEFQHLVPTIIITKTA